MRKVWGGVEIGKVLSRSRMVKQDRRAARAALEGTDRIIHSSPIVQGMNFIARGIATEKKGMLVGAKRRVGYDRDRRSGATVAGPRFRCNMRRLGARQLIRMYHEIPLTSIVPFAIFK